MTWCHEFFDDTFSELVLDRWDDADTQRTLAYLERTLGVARGGAILEQGAGNGRLAIPLARRGFRTIGVELSERYVEIARARIGAAPCTMVAADAARWLPETPASGVFNWATSFGFDDDGVTSRAMIARAFESLVPGGRYVLDYANVPRLLREHRDRLERRFGDVLVVRDSRLELARGTLEQTWTYVLADGSRRVRHGRTRLWMPHELREAFVSAGFRELTLEGDASGAPYDAASERCVVIGRRP